MNDQTNVYAGAAFARHIFIDIFTFLWGIFREHCVISVF
jgi:hypothetical protein